MAASGSFKERYPVLSTVYKYDATGRAIDATAIYDFNNPLPPPNNIYVWWGAYLVVALLLWGWTVRNFTR